TLLAESLGKERYDLWFGTRTRFTLNGSSLLVETPNRFLQDWQRQHYRGALEAACHKALGCEGTAHEAVTIEFRVNESLASEMAPCERSAQNKCADSANHTPHHEHLPAVSAVGKLFADNNCTAERNGHQVSPSKPRPGARTAGLTKIGNL